MPLNSFWSCSVGVADLALSGECGLPSAAYSLDFYVLSRPEKNWAFLDFSQSASIGIRSC